MSHSHALYVELSELLQCGTWNRAEITDCVERLGHAVALDSHTISTQAARLLDVDRITANIAGRLKAQLDADKRAREGFAPSPPESLAASPAAETAQAGGDGGVVVQLRGDAQEAGE